MFKYYDYFKNQIIFDFLLRSNILLALSVKFFNNNLSEKMGRVG